MIDEAVARLNAQLPLVARQRRLSPELATTHRLILRSFAHRGRPPTNPELDPVVGPNVAAGLQRLADDDLIVMAEGAIVGAYPFTTELTPHHLQIGAHKVRAMCSLDAVAVAPVFQLDVIINSVCAVTGNPILVEQRRDLVMTAEPIDLRVGVRWSEPIGNAAHSMCREMVFLSDGATAENWRGPDPQTAAVFDLPDAVEFGVRIFGPLLDDRLDRQG